MIVSIAAARIIPALGGILYDLQKVVARIIPVLGGILYDLQRDCCQDHSCVRWNTGCRFCIFLSLVRFS